MQSQNIFTLTIGGQAGQGIKSAGILLAKVAARSGYFTYDYTEYPSLIRGGHNVMQIRISKEEVTAPTKQIDFLVALNQATIDYHIEELKPNTAILYDGGSSIHISTTRKDIQLYPVPLSQLAREAGGRDLHSNTVALGALIGLLGGDMNILKQLISDEFADKGETVISLNHTVAQSGYTFAITHFGEKCTHTISPLSSPQQKMIINGNESVALGAIAAGMQFVAIYPMSPISNMIQTLAENQEKYGYIYKQPEDEIAAVTMAIGASYAGVRSMTATSGGGFCLMTEGYGLAGITETPLVIIEGMRGGPATGLPTWNEQGDLRFVLHAHQGEFPRIVLAAGDPQEAFYLTMEAFNLADIYQTPVVLLIDKNICENDQSFPMFDIASYTINRGKLSTDYNPDSHRYAATPDGISTRSIPGTGNFFVANSDEHTEIGISTEEIVDRQTQMDKRMEKLKTCSLKHMPDPKLYGPNNADITFVSWGSTKGAILQALYDFPSVNYLHLTWMNPFPSDAVQKILSNSKYVIAIENSYSQQLAGLIREKTGIDILDKVSKYTGRPFYPEEIVEKIRSVYKDYYKKL